MTEDEQIELVASVIHDAWGHWTAYMLDVLQEVIGLGFYGARDNNLDTEGLRKAKGCLAGWRRQIATPYAELTEKEKDSDREWADKILAMVGIPLPPLPPKGDGFQGSWPGSIPPRHLCLWLREHMGGDLVARAWSRAIELEFEDTDAWKT